MSILPYCHNEITFRVEQQTHLSHVSCSFVPRYEEEPVSVWFNKYLLRSNEKLQQSYGPSMNSLDHLVARGRQESPRKDGGCNTYTSG